MIRTDLRLTLWISVLLLLVSMTAAAVDSPWTLERYQHTSYLKRDGSATTVISIAQTSDGFMWFTDIRGITRFDGDKFEPFLPLPGERLINSQVAELFAPKSGGLWITYDVPGVSFIDHGHVTNYEKGAGWPGGPALFFEDRQGNVLAFGFPGLLKFVNGAWRKIAEEPQGSDLRDIAEDSSFNVWAIGKDGSLYVMREGATIFQDTGKKVDGAFGISTAKGGHLFVSSLDHRIHHLLDLKSQIVEVGQPIGLYTRHVVTDRRGDVWVGTANDGLHFLGPISSLPSGTSGNREVTDEKINESGGLTGNFARAFEDRRGDIWVGTENGVDRFVPSAFTKMVLPLGINMITITPGLRGDVWLGSENFNVMHVMNGVAVATEVPRFAITMYTDPMSGSVFAATPTDLWQVAPGTPGKMAQLPVKGGGAAKAITRDQRGQLWVTFNSDEPIDVLKKNLWEKRADIADAFSLATDATGTVWVGTKKNGLVEIKGNAIRRFSGRDGLSVGVVKVITPYRGAVWLGGDQGLQLFKGGNFRTLHLDGTLQLTDVSGALIDDDGTLWVHTLDGLFRVPAQAVERAQKDPNFAVPYRLFDADDGVPGVPSQMHALPSLQLASDGLLWISGGESAAWLNPNELPDVPTLEAPAIDWLIAGGQGYNSSANSIALPKKARNIQINYTVPALSAAKHMRFEYRLQGFDKEWQDAGDRRQAFYPHLSSGSYRFFVRASIDGKMWSQDPAELDFSIAPLYFETRWFQALCLVLLLALLFGTFRFSRARVITRLRAHMQIRFHEREAIARDLHDTLLQSTQSLALQLSALSKEMTDSRTKKALMQLASSTNDAVKEGRDKVGFLRTEGGLNHDLLANLTRMGVELGKLHMVHFTMDVRGRIRPFDDAAGEEIERIIAEALINAFRHANATRVSLSIVFKWWRFVGAVTDNGSGIDETMLRGGCKAEHWGIRGMRERAATLGASLTIKRIQSGGTEALLVASANRAYFRQIFPNVH